jgi:hypothetical protein
MEQKLTNTQLRILIGLSQQKQAVQQQFEEINKAEEEYFTMLKEKYELTDGEYRLEQREDGIYIVENVKQED